MRLPRSYTPQMAVPFPSGSQGLGLDSLIGSIDLVAQGVKPYAVSQTVRGGGEKQDHFAQSLGLSRIGLNHVTRSPGAQEPSQRARSIIFLAFGLAVATSLDSYHRGETVPLYICENGFIAINPPLTPSRAAARDFQRCRHQCTHPQPLCFEDESRNVGRVS